MLVSQRYLVNRSVAEGVNLGRTVVMSAGLLVACGSGKTPSGDGSTGTPKTFTLTFASSGDGSLSANGTACRANQCTASFADGTVVPLTATADPGAIFAGFTGDCSGATCVLTMSADHSASGSFTRPPPAPPGKTRLIVHLDGNGSVQSTPAGIDCGKTCAAFFDSGTSLTLLQTAASGFHFVGWGAGCSGAGSCFLTLAKDTDVFAKFEADLPPPPVDECAGLVPLLPAKSVDLSIPLGHQGCADHTATDGQGALLFGTDVQFETSSDSYTAFTRSGTRQVTVSATPAGQAVPYGRDSGFQWFVSGETCNGPVGGGCSSSTEIVNLTSSGDAQSIRTLYSWRQTDGTPNSRLHWRSANDPRGGMLVTRIDVSNGLWFLRAQRYDAAGLPMAAVTDIANGIGATPVGTVSGISETGLALVIWQPLTRSNELAGRWIDAGGTPFTGAFAVAGLPLATDLHDDRTASLERLLDGALVLKANGARATMIRSGSTASEPVPAWLAAHGDGNLSIVDGAKAYAFYDSPGLGCGPVQVSVHARSGKSCGGLALVPASGTCATAGGSGYDGTTWVVGTGNNGLSCTRSFWPGLFSGH